MIDPQEIPLKEVLEGALKYMQETKTIAKQSSRGYPLDVERCLTFQIEKPDNLNNRMLGVIDQLEKAVVNLLPGARHIVADVGLINDALCAATKLRRDLSAG